MITRHRRLHLPFDNKIIIIISKKIIGAEYMNRTLQGSENIRNFGSQYSGTSLIELSRALDIPKSSTYEIMQTLLKLKLAETHLYNPKLYVLGSKAFSIGSKYVSSNDIIHLGSHYLREVAAKYNKTGFMGFLDGDEVVCYNGSSEGKPRPVIWEPDIRFTAQASESSFAFCRKKT